MLIEKWRGGLRFWKWHLFWSSDCFKKFRDSGATGIEKSWFFGSTIPESALDTLHRTHPRGHFFCCFRAEWRGRKINFRKQTMSEERVLRVYIPERGSGQPISVEFYSGHSPPDTTPHHPPAEVGTADSTFCLFSLRRLVFPRSPPLFHPRIRRSCPHTLYVWISAQGDGQLYRTRGFRMGSHNGICSKFNTRQKQVFWNNYFHYNERSARKDE